MVVYYDSIGGKLPELGNGKQYEDYTGKQNIISTEISWDSWALQIIEAIQLEYEIIYEPLFNRALVIDLTLGQYYIYHP
jgi:hypothetical protein